MRYRDRTSILYSYFPGMNRSRHLTVPSSLGPRPLSVFDISSDEDEDVKDTRHPPASSPFKYRQSCREYTR